MKRYHRLNPFEREEISRCLAMNYSYRHIASSLGRSPSTICREISSRKFNCLNYRAAKAQKDAGRKAKLARKQRKLDKNIKLQKTVVKYLKLRWSPEQVAKYLKILYPNDMDMQVSHETIYAYVYVHPRRHLKRQLLFYLRRKHKYRRTRSKERRKSRPIQDFISIDKRPLEINARKVAGHWEGNLILGAQNQSAIGTLVERKTRMALLVKLKSKDATFVRKAFTRKFGHLPESLKKTLTYDQGQEMAEHKIFTERTKIQVYFAHPHSPWERGTNENTNSLIRDFFPKGTDFSRVSANELKKVQDTLNGRPRKTLNWHTPQEVFTKAVALEA